MHAPITFTVENEARQSLDLDKQSEEAIFIQSNWIEYTTSKELFFIWQAIVRGQLFLQWTFFFLATATNVTSASEFKHIVEKI